MTTLATLAAAPRWNLRWWHVAIIAFSILAAVWFSVETIMRQSGLARYRAVQARLKAEGRPVCLNDLWALASPADRLVQESFKSWERSVVKSKDLFPNDFQRWAAIVAGEQPLAEADRASLERARAEVETGCLLLRRGDLELNNLSGLESDLPPGPLTVTDLYAFRGPTLLVMRGLAEHLRREAFLAEDPSQACADLDALHKALSRPVSLIDSMIVIACDHIRDRAMVELAQRQRLPRVWRDRWLAEESQCLAQVAAGYTGERCMFVDACVNGLRQGGEDLAGKFLYPEQEAPSVLQRLNGKMATWLTGYADCAIMATTISQIEDRLSGRSRAPIPEFSAIRKDLHSIGLIAMPNLLASSPFALEADAHQRLTRLAVRVILLAEQGPLPADGAELLRRLENTKALDPGGDHLRLYYQRLAEDRFRLGVDPASPIPDFDAPGHMPARCRLSGKPASKKPLVMDRCEMELALPAK